MSPCHAGTRLCLRGEQLCLRLCYAGCEELAGSPLGAGHPLERQEGRTAVQVRQRVSGGTVERWPEHPCGWRMAAPRDDLHHLGAPHPNRGQQHSRANPTWAEENPADFMPRTLPVPSPPPIKLTPRMSPEAAGGQGRRLGELGRGAAPPHSRPPTRGSQNGPCRPAKACAHLPAHICHTCAHAVFPGAPCILGEARWALT